MSGETHGPARNTETCVLVGNRNHEILQGIRCLLKGMFDTVVMVADKESLLRSVRGLQPDMVVLSLTPPDEDPDLIRQLKARAPALDLIALSSHDDPVVAAHFLAAGASAFVLMSRVTEDLVRAVGAVSQGDTYVSPSR